MIFLTFLFYFLFVSKNSFVVHSVSFMEEILESSRTHRFVPNELKALSKQRKQFSQDVYCPVPCLSPLIALLYTLSPTNC